MNRVLGAVLAALAIVFTTVQAQAQGALGPGTQTPAVSDTQKTTAVNSNTQSQTNAAVNFTLSGIRSVIQGSLLGSRAIPAQRAALVGPSGDACEPAACGGDPWGWSVWVQGGGGQSINSLTVGGYNLGNYGTQVGVQVQITPKLLVGLGGSWAGTNGSLNGGFNSTSSIWGVTPYAGWQFDEHWNLSAIAGYSSGWTWLANPTTPHYSSAYQSSQWTLQGGLNGSYVFGDVFVAPNLSVTWVPTTTFGYTDSAGSFIPSRAASLTRGSVGAAVGMTVGAVQPYIRVSVEHDFALPPGSEANGDTGGTVGAGAVVALTEKLSVSIDGGYNSIGRPGLSLWSGSLRLGWRF
jgi:hypothetical protein